jgi:hypothetical protein
VPGTSVRAAGIALLLGLSPGLAACARDAVPAGGVRLVGRIVDDATGKPLPRDTLWIHGFTTTPKHQESLSPGSADSAFEMVLPARDVRLRVSDKSSEYLLWEKAFTASGPTHHVEVRLVPTGYVRLHGFVMRRDAGRLAPFPVTGEIGGRPGVFVGSHGLDFREDGSYSERVPRARHELRTINTALEVFPKDVDLSAEKGSDVRFDVVLGR